MHAVVQVWIQLHITILIPAVVLGRNSHALSFLPTGMLSSSAFVAVLQMTLLLILASIHTLRMTPCIPMDKFSTYLSHAASLAAGCNKHCLGHLLSRPAHVRADSLVC